jgi:putative phage-type endonuclease
MPTNAARRFTVIDCEQKTPEWFAARAGRVTSTSAAAMLAKGRQGAESVGKSKLRNRLALERVAGRSLEKDFTNRSMQQGTEREPEAYAAYEALTGRMLERTGFLSHNDLMAGCSLDGSCDDFTGIVEIKCPEHEAHFEALESGKIPGDYFRQVQHAIFVSGAEWCDWFSYNPDFPESLRVQLVRVNRTEVDLDAYEHALTIFLAEVDLKVQAIKTLTNLRGQLEAAVGQ